MSTATLVKPVVGVVPSSPPSESAKKKVNPMLASARKAAMSILKSDDNPDAIGAIPLTFLSRKHVKSVTIEAGRDFSESLEGLTVADIKEGELGVMTNLYLLEAKAIAEGSFSRQLAKNEKTTVKIVSGGRGEIAPKDACDQTSREFLQQVGIEAELIA